MLDSFEILTTSGVVLWSKTFTPIGAGVINTFIRDVFIEERFRDKVAIRNDSPVAHNRPYKYDKYTLRWTIAKDLELIFVAVYQSLLRLSWIDKLLENIQTLFTQLYQDRLRTSRKTTYFYDFDDYFNRQYQKIEKETEGPDALLSETDTGEELTPTSSSDNEQNLSRSEPKPSQPKVTDRHFGIDSTSNDTTPIVTPDTSRAASPSIKQRPPRKAVPGGHLSRRARKSAVTSAIPVVSSGDESIVKAAKSKGASKKMRKWHADGLEDDTEKVALDYSASTNENNHTSIDADYVASERTEIIDPASWGQRTRKGDFILKDLDEEMDSIIAKSDNKSSDSSKANSTIGLGLGVVGELFRNIVQGKTISKADLEKPLKSMEDHLLKKNVAREAAVRLCISVEEDLIGVKVDSFSSMQKITRSAMESALRKILTLTNSLDLLREIRSITSPSTMSYTQGRPFVISIVGVNGVGKSTNLSKMCFFLLQNKLRVLIAAADTFRSGAVEQLRVHARNLEELSAREGGHVALFERGYGKDAANIAKDAVSFAAENKYDVVLIDTAGRRHNDQRLMSSLEKFAKLAKPDKILMVGEALVGSDSVQQARNFNVAFGKDSGLDGFIISKCDTVGDMVGTLVSMVHATGIPVLFLGTGQNYSDLRTLNVKWAVDLLMK